MNEIKKVKSISKEHYKDVTNYIKNFKKSECICKKEWASLRSSIELDENIPHFKKWIMNYTLFT